MQVAHYVSPMDLAIVKDGYQRTVGRPIEFTGVGLHTNRQVSAILEPARVNTGIRILRLDTGALIPVNYNYLVDTMYATVVGTKEGDSVSTVEHFMAALYAMEVDNVIIKVDGPEMPILDGSAHIIANKMMETGFAELGEERESIAILDSSYPLQLDDASITLSSSDELTLEVEVDFPGTLIGNQKLTLPLTPETFFHEISPARTFVLKEQIEMLWSSGLALGGSLDNAVVVDGYHILNSGGLRFADEFVRHKILDLIGDLSLLGKRLICHVGAFKPGHTINSMVIKEISRRMNTHPLNDSSFINVASAETRRI